MVAVLSESGSEGESYRQILTLATLIAVVTRPHALSKYDEHLHGTKHQSLLPTEGRTHNAGRVVKLIRQ